MTKLSQNNNLIKGENGVWALDGKIQPFDYSDGAATEQYLRQLFDSAANVSAQSAELKAAIFDWPTTYHLSPIRGNLFRPFNMETFASALDIGAGCGSIARYLGEHIAQVDAIEGAAIRADLARRRCRDLDNVNVINANFNLLDLDGANYDLATLIGVAEYAGKFVADAQSDEHAVQVLLANVANALADDGVVMIAIENRLGAKYIVGANEDHYHSPYEGIVGYPRKHGMCTYDLNEWRTILADSSFQDYAIYGAFPDYKLPTALIGEAFARDAQVLNHISEYHATLGVGTWCKGEVHKMWHGAVQLEKVMEMANSFFILAAKSEKGLSRLKQLDFAHTPRFNRRPEFTTVISKQCNSDMVERRPLDSSKEDVHNDIDHKNWAFKPLDETYIRGKSLLLTWLEVFELNCSYVESLDLLKEYYKFLKVAEENGDLQVDTLPQNIVVDENGQYQVFDQEWRFVDYAHEAPLSGYVFFRGALQLAPHSRHLGEFYRLWNCRTLHDFVRECLFAVDKELGKYFEDFVALEHSFLSFAEGQEADLNYLRAPINDERAVEEAPWLWANIALIDTKGEQKDWTQRYALNAERNHLAIAFDSPQSIEESGRFAFSPSDFRRSAGIGLIRLESVRLKLVDGSTMALNIDAPELKDLIVSDIGERRGYAFDGSTPTFSFKIPTAVDVIAVEIDFILRSSVEYWQIEQQLLIERDQLKTEIAWLRRQITRPDLPASLTVESVPNTIPEAIKSKVLRQKHRLKKLGKGASSPLELPQHAIPMDWRFMPPAEVVSDSSGVRLSALSAIATDLSAKDKRQLKKVATRLQTVEPDLSEVGAVLRTCEHEWVWVMDSNVSTYPFQLGNRILVDEPVVYFGDELIEHDGWKGVRREPKRLKHAAISGYCNVGAVLINPAAKELLQDSRFELDDDAPAYAVVLAAIHQGIAVRHCGTVLTQCYYPVFVWPPNQQSQAGARRSRERFINHYDEPRQVKICAPAGVDGIDSYQYCGDSPPKVSIIIPFRDNPTLLQNCIEGVMKNTWYEHFEIIGVNNSSVMERTYEVMRHIEEQYKRVRFVDACGEFNFSRIVNDGVAQSDGEFVVLMNNDVLIDTPDWVQYLLAPFFLDKKCGVTSLSLNYPEGIVQSSGIAIGEDGLPVNIGNNMLANDKAVFGRLYASRDVLAVSAALLMTKREVFDRLGGLDEEQFAVAFNDVDYCLRAAEEGLDIVLVGRAQARHYESYSRARDTAFGSDYQRFAQEQQAFKERHAHYANASDPYHPEIERKA